MLFDPANYKPYGRDDLFLGLDDTGREIGLKTNRHAITIAGARSGKGACCIIPNLLRWPENVLVIDPKGENAIKTWETRQGMGANVHILDPFKQDGVPEQLRAAFNPLDLVDPESLSAAEDIEVIADGLVKRSDPKHAQWDDGAAAILAGVIAYVISEAPAENRTLKDVRAVLLQPRDELYADAQRMLKCDGCGGLAKDAGLSIMTAFDSEKSMESDFLGGARRHSKWLDRDSMVGIFSHSTFQLSDIKHGNASVYLVLPFEYLETHGAFLRLFVRCAILAMAKGGSGKGKRCLFILDEFFSLGKIDAISASCGAMPSYGVHLWPILQDLGQLVTLYGEQGSSTFFANSDLHQFFGNTDKPTLEYMSFMTGQIGIGEIGAAPDAPTITGGSPSLIAAASAHSKDGMTRGMGAAWGAISGGIGQAIAAAESADHQNKMNEYQQKMATVGRPRITPDEMAKLVQRKNDDIADNMFCITHGSDRLLLKPAPYFRKHEVNQVEKSTQRKSGSVLVSGLKFGAIGAILGAAKASSSGHSGDDPVAMALLVGIFGFIVGSVVELIKSSKNKSAISKSQPDMSPAQLAPDAISDDEILNELRAGRPITAIKLVRAKTGCNLATAQKEIERMKGTL